MNVQVLTEINIRLSRSMWFRSFNRQKTKIEIVTKNFNNWAELDNIAKNYFNYL